MVSLETCVFIVTFKLANLHQQNVFLYTRINQKTETDYRYIYTLFFGINKEKFT